MIILIVEMGAISPPEGINMWVVKGIADVPVSTVFRGVIPFCLAVLVCTMLLLIFPQIVTFLPNVMSY